MELLLGYLLGAATVFIGAVWYLKRERKREKAKAERKVRRNIRYNNERFGNN